MVHGAQQNIIKKMNLFPDYSQRFFNHERYILFKNHVTLNTEIWEYTYLRIN